MPGLPVALMELFAQRPRMTTPDELLERITIHFRNGCVLRRSGKLDEAQEAFAAVPAEIHQWTVANTTQTSEQKKAKLREVFQKEQARVEDAYLVCDLVTERLENEWFAEFGERLAAEVSQRVLSEVNAIVASGVFQVAAPASPPPTSTPLPVSPVVPSIDPNLAHRLAKPRRIRRERVSFDDISGMIDMLMDQEYDKRK